MEIIDPVFTPPNRSAVVKPYLLSHGTLEVYSLAESRPFYEEFLGLECVRHAKPSMLIRCGMKWHVVAVEVGDAVHPCGVLNHWGVEVRTQEEVDQAHRDALRLKDKYGIRTIMPPSKQHGVYCFYLEDRDHNWWEIAFTPNFRHDDHYDFGDRFPMDEPAGEVQA